jgi:hypothetical protein
MHDVPTPDTDLNGVLRPQDFMRYASALSD